MTPAIRQPLRPRVMWIVGGRLEIEYLDCRDQVVTRRPKNLHRQPQIVREVAQVLRGR